MTQLSYWTLPTPPQAETWVSMHVEKPGAATVPVTCPGSHCGKTISLPRQAAIDLAVTQPDFAPPGSMVMVFRCPYCGWLFDLADVEQS